MYYNTTYVYVYIYIYIYTDHISNNSNRRVCVYHCWQPIGAAMTDRQQVWFRNKHGTSHSTR